MRKDIRYMGRQDLLKVLLDVQKENETLRQENESLKAELAKQQLEAQELGSIAEVAMRLNHVFEDAQRAADQYVASAKAMYAPAQPEEDEQTQEADDGEA